MNATRKIKTVPGLSIAIATISPCPDQPDIDRCSRCIVTGFRASPDSALNVKRNETASIGAINLTDTKKDPFVVETVRLNVLTHSGRPFNFGARYAF